MADHTDDPVLAGAQELLDSFGEGWAVSNYVICLYLERIQDNTVEQTTWWHVPAGQPDPMTVGLIAKLAGQCGAGELVGDDEAGDH